MDQYEKMILTDQEQLAIFVPYGWYFLIYSSGNNAEVEVFRAPDLLD